MTPVHRVVGFSIPVAFALIALWALVAFVRDRAPGALFWNLVAAVQVLIGLQVLVGIVLFATGARPDAPGTGRWLHYVYGGIGPAIVLIAAHRLAARVRPIAWAVFGAAAFVSFGLTLRALQTGFGT